MPATSQIMPPRRDHEAHAVAFQLAHGGDGERIDLMIALSSVPSRSVAMTVYMAAQVTQRRSALFYRRAERAPIAAAA